MIDPNDSSTLPLLPNAIPVAKKRGIKPTGNAKSSAQRKAAQRARDGWKMVNAAIDGNYSNVTLTGLLEQLAVAVREKNIGISEAITKELLRRARQK